MFYTGRVKNGVILADEPVELPEGAIVRFEIMPKPEALLAFGQRFSEVMEKAQGLSDEAAENHDH